MTNRDLDPRTLVVQDAERLSPQQRDTLLGWLAVQNIAYHDLPASDVKIRPPKVPGLEELLESLPENVDYGHFSFEELMDFAESYFEGNVTERAIKHRVGHIWNILTGKSKYQIKPALVTVRQDRELVAPSAIDWGNQPSHPKNRASFSLSLGETVAEIKKYPEYAKLYYSRNPFYGLGPDTIGCIAEFAKSRAQVPEVAEA